MSKRFIISEDEKNIILEKYNLLSEQNKPVKPQQKPINNPTQGTPSCLAKKSPSWDATAGVWWIKLPDGGFWSFDGKGVYKKEGSKNHGFYKCNGDNIEYLKTNDDFIKRIQNVLQSKGFYIGQNGSNGEMTADTLISIMNILENPQNPNPQKTQEVLKAPDSVKQQPAQQTTQQNKQTTQPTKQTKK